MSSRKSASKQHINLLKKLGLDAEGLPMSEGIYLIPDPFSAFRRGIVKIDVYEHPIKGLSCFADDFGSGGTDGVDDDTDCHVSVQFSGLEFICRFGDLE